VLVSTQAFPVEVLEAACAKQTPRGRVLRCLNPQVRPARSPASCPTKSVKLHSEVQQKLTEPSVEAASSLLKSSAPT